VIAGHRLPAAKLDALFEVTAGMSAVTLSQVRPMNGKLMLLPLSSTERLPSPSARLQLPLAERIQQLRAAEEAATSALQRAEAATVQISASLLASVHSVAESVHENQGAQTSIYPGVAAIPDSQRSRAPGVPGEVVAIERGWMSVTTETSSSGQPGVTLVIAVAFQLVEPETVRLHAVAEVETPDSSRNIRQQVWRMTRQCSLAEADVKIEELSALVLEGSAEALGVFHAAKRHHQGPS